MTIILKNEFCVVTEFENYISFADYTDMNNLPSGYTTAKRGFKKAVDTLKEMAKDEALKNSVKFGTICRTLEALKMKPHTYCAMD